jgi:hypothetical protein
MCMKLLSSKPARQPSSTLSLYVWDPPISYEAVEFSMWIHPSAILTPLSLSVRMGSIALLLLEPRPWLEVAAPAVEVLRRWHGKRLPALGRQL